MTIETVEHLFAPKLPLRIKEARARAVEHPKLFLKGKVTAMVQVLITYTNLDNTEAPILFRRDLPAAILGVSTRTIDRLLRDLEGLGWLQRLPQPKLRAGVWGCTSIRWSRWVITDIFTAKASNDKWGSKERRQRKVAMAPDLAPQTACISQNHSHQKTPLLDGDRATESAHLSTSPNGEVFQNKVASDDSLKSHFDPFGERKSESRRIPDDLVVPMKEFSLTPANICWLMARCKSKGVRLQHILAATGDQLRTKGLRARKALAWLMYMIGLDRDYRHEARAAEQRVHDAQRKARRKAWLADLSSRAFVPGRTLPNGLTVDRHAGDLVTLLNHTTGRQEACPTLTLARSLATHYPWWARAVLRGLDAARYSPAPLDGASQDAPALQPTPIPLEEDKAAVFAYLDGLKTLLRHRPSFAG